METTVNKEGENYMKQMFKTCENTYKVFYHITFMEICKSYKIVPKDLYVKKDLCMNLRKIITNVFLVMYMLCIIKLKQRQAALRALTHLTPRYLRKALYNQTIM